MAELDEDAETATCDGKEKLTKQQAKNLAGRLRRKSHSRIQPYKCRACGNWHVGSSAR